MALQWDRKLATGVEQLDAQHRELIRQINNLTEAMTSGRGRDELGRMFDFLKKYTTDHFSEEEAVMDRVRCPVAEANRKAHAYFVRRLQELRSRFDAQGPQPTLALDIHRELGEWLVKHIGAIDTQLVKSVAPQPAGAGA